MTEKEMARALFASWLEATYPAVFVEMARRAGIPNAGGAVLAGWSDVLSSIGSAASKLGSGISTAATAVGNFLGSQAGQNVLAAVVATKAASSGAPVIATQLARANAGIAPAAIGQVYDPTTGTYQPVATTVTGQYAPLTTQILNSLKPSFFQEYGPWLLAGGAGIVALLAARS